MAVALVFLLRTFSQVIAVLAFFFVINYTLSFVSLFVLRRREPDTYRPYRASGLPVDDGHLARRLDRVSRRARRRRPRTNSRYMLGLLC